MTARPDDVPVWIQVAGGALQAAVFQLCHPILFVLYAGCAVSRRTGGHAAFLDQQEQFHWLLAAPGLTQLLWAPALVWLHRRAGHTWAARTLAALCGTWLLVNLWYWRAWAEAS